MVLIRNLLAIVVSIFSLLLFVPMLIIGISLWMVSSLTQIITRLIQPKYASWRDLIEFESVIGWKPMSNLDTHYIAVGNDICHIITDSQGWLGKNSLSESDIVVVGDSYAFGYGVNIHDSYFEVDPNLRIKAIGSPGYNMVQELILMRQLSTELTNKLVVWFVCLQNDLHDNLRPDKPNFYRTPFVHSINGGTEWEVVTNHVKKAKWPYPTLNRPYASMFAKLCMQSHLSQHVYSACDFLIREGRNACNKVGAHLVVMTIPSKDQLALKGPMNIARNHGSVSVDDINVDYPDQMFGGICRKLNVPFYTAKDFMNIQDYKTHDCHWTEQGNRKVAKFLADIYDDYITENLCDVAKRDRCDMKSVN